jgi:hypothetical protein
MALRKEGRKEGCSLDEGLPGCNLPTLLQNQPGCIGNASQSINWQNKRKPIQVLQEIPTKYTTKKHIPLIKDPT